MLGVGVNMLMGLQGELVMQLLGVVGVVLEPLLRKLVVSYLMQGLLMPVLLDL